MINLMAFLFRITFLSFGAAWLVLPQGVATAATVSSDESSVSIVALPSEENEFRIIWQKPQGDRNVEVLQQGTGGPDVAPLIAGPGCVQVDENVECQADNEATFNVATDDLRDEFDFFSADSFKGRVVANLGAGDDSFDVFSFADVPTEVRGGQGDDYVIGSKADDRIWGGPGDDVIGGSDGADLVDGGPGNDALYGQIGQDVVRGGEGDDELHGLLGPDLINGGEGADFLAGGGDADTLKGRGGQDRIDAAHRDVRAGGENGFGLDKIADRVNCGDGRDRLKSGPEDRSSNCERRKLIERTPGRHTAR